MQKTATILTLMFALSGCSTLLPPKKTSTHTLYPFEDKQGSTLRSEASTDMTVSLRKNESPSEAVVVNNEVSTEKRAEISKAINETENDLKKIVSKETPAKENISAVSNEIDSALNDMDKKADEAALKPAAPSAKSVLVEVKTDTAQTENARTQAELALAGKATSQEPQLADRVLGTVPAEKALGWLKNGNRRFYSGKLRADGQSKKDRERTAKGQTPHAAIITCSDSRMVPELIFDQKLGEIYSIRVVDLSVALNVQASLDYAINSLGTNLVVLLGSETCGTPEKLEFLYNQLLEKSAILRQAAVNDQIRVVRGMYNLNSGIVEFK